MRMQAHSVIDFAGGRLNDEHMTPGAKLLGSAKKKNQSLLREAGVGLAGISLNQNSKNEAFNFESLNRDMNKGS